MWERLRGRRGSSGSSAERPSSYVDVPGRVFGLEKASAIAMLGEFREKTQLILGGQLTHYLNSFYEGIELSQEASGILSTNESPKDTLVIRALRQGRQIINRNNQVAEYLMSAAFKLVKEREEILQGECSIGVSKCIDGRLPEHIFAFLTGMSETMAGVLPTETRLDGKKRLKNKTLEQSIARRAQEGPLLEWMIAHTKCGAMKKWQGERAGKANKFKSGDLIAENFNLFQDSIEAITDTYNSTATANGKTPLERVCVRAVYDVDTMGITVGYGEEQQLSSTALAQQLCGEFEDVHAIYADSFTDLDHLKEKETAVIDLVDRLFKNQTFNKTIENALSNLQETAGLTAEQQQAFRFFIARFTAFQILTGVHTGKEESHIRHPFAEHDEQYMAISVEEGLNVTVGQYEPEDQVFGAVVSGKEEAIDHILTEESLMTAHGKEHPHLLFISNAIDEEAVELDSPTKYKQARANLARNFWDIVNDPRIAREIQLGRIVPIPVIMGNRSREILEIPNLAL